RASAARAGQEADERLRRHADLRGLGRPARGAHLPQIAAALRLRREPGRRREPDRAPGHHDPRQRPRRHAQEARHRRWIHPLERRDREWPGSGRRSFAGARARVVSERRAAWGIALAAAAVAALVAVLALFTGRTPRRESRPAVDAGPSSLSDAGTPAPGGEAAVGSKAPLFGAWT